MDIEQIEGVVSDIMIEDGPDGHCDGADLIASFVVAVRDGYGDAWATAYADGGRAAVERLAPPNYNSTP